MEITGIEKAATAMKGADLQTSVSMAVLDKTLEIVEESMAAMLEMLEVPADPNVGGSLDIKI